MLFPTFEFLVFFTIIFLLYWYVFTRAKDRKVLLVLASFVFYSFSSLGFAFLMFAFALVNWGFALVFTKLKNYRPRKLFLIFAVSVDILYLLYFKEAYSFISLINRIFPKLFAEETFLHLLSMTAIIPLGVSYYVFKACSYLFDIFVGKLKPRSSPFDVLLYLSFFPQIFSGPIVNATYFFDNLKTALEADKDAYEFIPFDRASLLIVLGLIKKSIVASFLSILITKPVFANPMNFNTLDLLFAALAYSVVIYADFSGYSDMSIGIASLLGFKTPANFDRPYTSKNISEFWRRWHISFSSWLRDYVYFAFGGSRFGAFRTVIALMGTMIIGGLWHSVRWTFFIWGILQGSALAIERLLELKNEKSHFNLGGKTASFSEDSFYALSEQYIYSELKINNSETPEAENFATQNKKAKKLSGKAFSDFSRKEILSRLATFLFVTFSWIFFRAESLNEVWLFFASLKNFTLPITMLNPFCFFLVFASIGLQFVPKTATEKAFAIYCKMPFVIKAVALALVFLSIRLFATSGISEFIYFQF
ncbi:MAG: MBOAT family protein [Treponemataceae bacterium]